MTSKPKKSQPLKFVAGLARLQKRTDFLATAATRRRWITPGFIVQARPKRADKADATPSRAARVGFTVSKKVGNAVLRNRVRRRLKEAAIMVMLGQLQEGWDYVIVGRKGCQDIPYRQLLNDLKWALGKLHSGADLKSGKKA